MSQITVLLLIFLPNSVYATKLFRSQLYSAHCFQLANEIDGVSWELANPDNNLDYVTGVAGDAHSDVCHPECLHGCKGGSGSHQVGFY